MALLAADIIKLGRCVFQIRPLRVETGQYRPGAPKKFDRTGRPSITKTERPRLANLLQMPRGLMCKLRQRGRDYGGPAGSRGIDPSLQPLPSGAVLYGRGASRRPGHAFRLNPNSGPVCPACDIGVALLGGLFCICEWPISASTSRPVLAEIGHSAFQIRPL